jgi:Tfp pilus assembly protein PilX
MASTVPPSEGGMALIVTIIVMFVVVSLITIIFTEGMQALPLARQAQDYQAALQAAESGVQDYINRLDNNTAYYLSQYDSTNTALENDTSGTPTWTSWAAVAGTNVSEWYRYAVNNTNAAKTGIVYLIVSGAAGQNPATSPNYTVRTIKEGISLTGFTNFLYFTDYEIEDPQLVSSFSVNGKSWTYNTDCRLHAWEYNTDTTGYGPDPNNCSRYFIDFVPTDTLNGPIFSNDEFHICGAASFPQGATSAYDQGTSASVTGTSSYGNPGTYYSDSSCSGTPTFGGTAPQPAGAADELFPATNSSMESDLATTNDGGGCAYAGPVGIVFSNSGTMTVTLPAGSAYLSSVLSSSYSTTECGTNGATVAGLPLPPNGLIYDENPASGCASSTCQADAYVSGSVNGQVTVGSQNNINITGNLTDADTMTGTDIIGLSATNSIYLPDDLSCALGKSCAQQSGSTTNTLPTVSNITIDAAMVALDHSFVLPDFSNDPVLGTLTLNGSIAQEYRGPVGTHNSSGSIASGYSKTYTYDSRLKFLQPPYFTSPTLPNWIESSFAECNSTSTPVATTC